MVTFKPATNLEDLFAFVDAYRERRLFTGQNRFPVQSVHCRARQYSRKIPEFIGRVRALKIFADFPFEWMRFGTTPLSYTRGNVSHPAYAPAEIAMDIIRKALLRRTDLTIQDVQTVRVLTCFGRRDPLKGAFV